MTRTNRDRKVRGSRIRDSREEKTRENGSGGPQAQRGGRTVGTGTPTTESRTRRENELTDAPGLDRPFVETESTAAVRSRIERWLAADRPVHLIGPTGCGKTAMAIHVAGERDRPVVFINGDSELETSDLVGEYAEEEREHVRDRYVHNVMKSKDIIRDRWVDNPLTVAAREGATLVYNEFSRTKPVANNVLLSMFEEGVLELPGRRGSERYVDVHPEFRAILTSNPVEYAGVHDPQDALLDRLVGIHMEFYDADTERRIVGSRVDLGEETVGDVVAVLRDLRERLAFNVGTRAMIMAAEGLAVEGATDPDPETLRAVCLDVLASKVSGRDAVADLRAEIDAAVAARLE